MYARPNQQEPTARTRRFSFDITQSKNYECCWKIGHEIDMEPGFVRKSPSFPNCENTDAKWYLLAEIVAKQKGNCLSIYPQLKSYTKTELNGTYTLEIISGKGGIFYLPKVAVFSVNGKVEGANFYSISDYCDADGVISVVCNVRIFDASQTVYPRVPVKPSTVVLSGLEALLSSGLLSDVVLVAGGREFAAHRALLAARSEVFAAMFLDDTEQALTGRVQVRDVDAGVMSSLLAYLYTGKQFWHQSMEQKAIEQLVTLSYRYGIEELKKELQLLLPLKCEVSDAAALLATADRERLLGTKLSVEDFIKSNLAQVARTGGWKKLIQECPDLVLQLWGRKEDGRNHINIPTKLNTSMDSEGADSKMTSMQQQPVMISEDFTWHFSRTQNYKCTWRFGHQKDMTPGFKKITGVFSDSKVLEWRLLVEVCDKNNVAYLNLYPQLKTSLKKSPTGTFSVRIISGRGGFFCSSKVTFDTAKTVPSAEFCNPSCYCDTEGYITVVCELMMCMDQLMNLRQRVTQDIKIRDSRAVQSMHQMFGHVNVSTDDVWFQTQLLHDLGRLLSSGQLSDVVVVVENKEFAAHRVVLAARSEVFAAMFRHDMQEARAGRIEVSDVDKETMSKLLAHIYTGELPDSGNRVANETLLMAADKYGLLELKQNCESLLKMKLNVEEATSSMIFAHCYNLPNLKKALQLFIKRNLNQVANTQGWSHAVQEYPELVLELLSLIEESGSAQTRNVAPCASPNWPGNVSPHFRRQHFGNHRHFGAINLSAPFRPLPAEDFLLNQRHSGAINVSSPFRLQSADDFFFNQ